MSDIAYGAGLARPSLDRNIFTRWWSTIDRPTLGWIGALLIAGVLLSFASSPVAAVRTGMSDPYYYVYRHAMFALGAAAVLGACSLLSPLWVRRLGGLLYVGALLVMMYVLFAGHESKGAARWIRVAGFSFQPSEILKPAIVVLTAWLFAERVARPGFPGLRLAFALWVVPVFLLLRQPDVGQTFLITFSMLIVFVLAGLPLVWAAGLLAAAGVGAVGLYFILPHMADRVNGFINAADGPAFQVERALDAISSGGLIGRGPGEGVIKRSLPDGHTDFIYALASEEFGLIAGLFLIIGFAVVVVRGLSASAKLNDPFRQIAAAGLFTIFGLQAAINVAVNLHLVPPKGMTLPLISYGGSSMLGTAITLGLALALTRRRAGV
jgi:cell division protein FtsW